MPRKKAALKKPRQRRPKGTGSFFFSESRGLYVGRAIVGRKSDGKPLYVERSDPTESGLVAKLAAVKPATPETTVREWLERWLKEIDVRPRTLDIRTSAINGYFNPTLGHLRLCDVTTQQVNRALAEWLKALAASTVRMYLAVLHTAMKAAQNAGLRPDNPVAGAKRPPVTKKKIDPFSVSEVNRIIAEALRRPATRICALIAATGCRGGEALALNVDAYDPLTGLITISQTQHEDGERGPTKTATGQRTIEVPEDARPALVAAIGSRGKGPLFTTHAGRHTSKFNYRNSWIRLLKRVGLKYRNIHQCRHTVATLMLAAGYSVGDVAAYIGDTPESVMRTYCHATGANVGRGIQGLLNGAKGE